MDWVDIKKDPKHVATERKKANQLKKSSWWQNKLQTGICHYCQKKLPAKSLTMDHIVPLSRGGKSTKGNIVPCCLDCNQNKKYLTPVEMILNKIDS